jgi:hypothetical protein
VLAGSAIHQRQTVDLVSVTVLLGLVLTVRGIVHWLARGFDRFTSFDIDAGDLALNLSFLEEELAPVLLLLVVALCAVTIARPRISNLRD